MTVELRKSITTVEPFVWWKRETWSRERTFTSDVLVETDNAKESKWDIYWSACYILDMVSAKAKRNELLGDYPAKSLNNVR